MKKLFNAVKGTINGIFANLFLIENTVIVTALAVTGILCYTEVSTKGGVSNMLHNMMESEYKKTPIKSKSPQRRKTAKKDI